MTSSSSSVVPVKKDRTPGRPTALFTYDETIQIRLNHLQLMKLDEQATAVGCSRSAIVRAALDGVTVLHPLPSAEQRNQYRQLVDLATCLQQLVAEAKVGQQVQAQAKVALEQVQQCLTNLSAAAS